MCLTPEFFMQLSKAKIFGEKDFPIADVTIDSRIKRPNSCFFALKGMVHDGADFIEQAIESGAAVVVLPFSRLYQKEIYSCKLKAICFVEDTREALLEAAKIWRSKFNIPVVGITGTVGKTTTKEMLTDLLKSYRYSVLSNEGTLNTVIGLSLTILRLRPEHTILVCELGISLPGEMTKLVDILRPTIACITCVGKGHLEGLKSVSGVCREKCQIFSLFDNTCYAVIRDQSILRAQSITGKKIIFGTKNADIQMLSKRFHENKCRIKIRVNDEEYQIKLNTLHDGFVYNFLACSGILKALNLDLALLSEYSGTLSHIKGRFILVQTKYKFWVIDDAYNANPESLKAALKAFKRLKTKLNKSLVLADMLELGKNKEKIHAKVSKLLSNYKSHKVIFVGNLMRFAFEKYVSQNKYFFQTPAEAFNFIKANADALDIFLCKGSRGMKLLESL